MWRATKALACQTRPISGNFVPAQQSASPHVGVGQVKLMGVLDIYYYFIKITFFFALVRAQLKSDLIKDHFIFLGVLYTAAVWFLSYMFMVSSRGPDSVPGRDWAWEIQLSTALNQTRWVTWLAETLLLSTLYFKLMAKFDEGVIFWTLLLLGILVALF
jgi:hypothetical protein